MAAYGTPGHTPYEASQRRLIRLGVFLVTVACIGIAVLLWPR